MPLSSPLPAWLQRFGPRAPSAFDDFEQYSRHVTGWAGVLACLGGVSTVLFWWPADRLYAGDPQVLQVIAAWRQAMVLMGTCGGVAVAMLWRMERNTFPLQGMLFGLATLVSFSLFSTIGGPGTPWIHAAPMVPMATLFLAVSLPTRIFAALGAWTLIGLAYYGPHPEWVSDRYAVNVGILSLSSVVFSVLVGQLLYVLSERNFRQHKALVRLATTDALTGCLNRRAFVEQMRAEARRAARYQHALTLVMLDLDHFKAINDTHGHAVGDVVLEQVVARLRPQLRDSDGVGRLGGEEFAVLLPQTSLAAAEAVAERLRGAIAGEPVTAGSAVIDVTASFGVACVLCQDCDCQRDAVRKALRDVDRALYAAKSAGRNRVQSIAAVAA